MTRSEAIEVIGCSWSSLRRYAADGRIRTTRLQNGKLNYWDEDVYAMVGKKISRDHWVVLYSRVNGSGEKAKAKMLEQQRLCYAWCAKRGLTIDKKYEDWAPSTDFSENRRPGLHEMLKDVIGKRVDAVVVETRDRLCRVGWELFKMIFKYYGVELVIVNKVIEDPYYQKEQAEDLAKILDQARVDRLGEIKEGLESNK